MVPKLTLDGGLLREGVLLPAIRTLKSWETEGRIELFESDRAKERPAARTQGWPGGPSPSRPHSRFRAPRKLDSKGISFQQISAVLFPMRDPHRLDRIEVNDVAHLLRHHSLGHAIFVTNNEKNFIADGKRERLEAAFKILILTPEETVQALSESGSIDQTEKKGRASHE